MFQACPKGSVISEAKAKVGGNAEGLVRMVNSSLPRPLPTIFVQHIMNDPITKLAPSESEIKNMVDQLITPENADREAKVLIRLLAATGSTDDTVQIENSEIAARHAFTKTLAYERAVETAYRDFTGFPVSGFNPPGTIEIAGRAG